jgi:riboflavin kinase/FMN adenylyltransferase
MTQVLTGDPATWERVRGSALTVGVFDGVHLGHQALLERVCRLAAGGREATVLTFDPHPLEVVAPERAPRMLTTIPQRVELLSALGVATVGVLDFGRIRHLSAEEFAVEILAGRLRAEVVAIGADFRFGRDRRGDPELLASVGRSRGFDVEIVATVTGPDGEPYSSTRIRSLLAEGRVAEAASLLGRPYELRATVVRGDARGRSIGFPTANLAMDGRMALPADGVYAVRARVAPQGDYPAVVNVGVRPTFGGGRRTVEAHLLDFEGDLYHQEVSVRFVERLRGERRFGSVEELRAQLAVDVEAGRAALEEA